jgi:lantibiotic transport system permease protein
MNLLISLRAELLKTKRTAVWYLTILSAISIPLIFVIDVNGDGVSPENKNNPLLAIFIEGLKGVNLLILPMFVILVCTLLLQLEYRNNTWKQVLTSPQKMAQVYLAKFACVQLFILLFMAVFITASFFGSLAIDAIDPTLKLFTHAVDWKVIAGYFTRTYVCILAFSAVQFIIALQFKNFIAPIAIGFILWVTGILLVFQIHASFANLFPYSYSTMVMFPMFEKQWTVIQWGSAGYGTAFLIGGYLWFQKKKVRG